MTVLEKIEKLRLERGWSVNYLALEAMLTQSTLNNLYSRNAEPKISTLRAICGAFGISLSEFFTDCEDKPKDNVTEELNRRVSCLTDEQKNALLTLLRSIK